MLIIVCLSHKLTLFFRVGVNESLYAFWARDLLIYLLDVQADVYWLLNAHRLFLCLGCFASVANRVAATVRVGLVRRDAFVVKLAGLVLELVNAVLSLPGLVLVLEESLFLLTQSYDLLVKDFGVVTDGGRLIVD